MAILARRRRRTIGRWLTVGRLRLVPLLDDGGGGSRHRRAPGEGGAGVLSDFPAAAGLDQHPRSPAVAPVGILQRLCKPCRVAIGGIADVSLDNAVAPGAASGEPLIDMPAKCGALKCPHIAHAE